MSAFLVQAETIAALASYAAAHKCCNYGILAGRGIFEPEKIAEILAEENIRSVSARYEREPDEADFMYINQCKELVKRSVSVSTGQIAKHLSCLEYQSCETDDYYQTDAYKILVTIMEDLLDEAPGYKAANWG